MSCYSQNTHDAQQILSVREKNMAWWIGGKIGIHERGDGFV